MREIIVREEQSEEKLRGGYYTPFELTEFITKYIFSKKKFKKSTILEPSVGDGRFYDSFKKVKYNFKMTGVELIEKEALKSICKVENDDRFKTINKDFYKFYHENRNKKYEAIVGNPPYIRYQLLTEEQRDYQSEIMLNNGLKANRLINSWVAFTVASIEMLENNGIIAFVLPTDLLQVSYAKELRRFLYSELSEVNIINFNKTVFKDIQQDVLLMIGTKKNNSFDKNHELRLINIDDKKDLLNLDLQDYPLESKEFIEEFYLKDKWSTIYLNNNERSYYYDLRKNNNVVMFNDYIKGQVGITTGNNKVFAVSESIVKKYELEDYIVPLLGRSIEADGIIYKQIDLKNNILKDKNVWLLDFNKKKIHGKAKEYIKNVERKNEHRGYKLDLREKWYEVPSIWIPDAFLLRRVGSHPKIILNELNCTSTDTFHRLLFKEGINEKLMIISLYSSLSLMSLELEGRVFAGGALEVLPGDLKNILIPKLNFRQNYRSIDIIFDELDNKMRSKENIESIVLWVNEELLKLGYLDSNVLKESYKIWKKSREKRILK